MGRHVKNCLTCEYFICHKQNAQFEAHRLVGTPIMHTCELTRKDYKNFLAPTTKKDNQTLKYLLITCGSYKFGKLQTRSLNGKLPKM